MRKLAWFAAAFAVAALLCVYVLSLVLGLVCSFVCFLALLFFWRKVPYRRIAIVLLGLGVGFAWCSGYEQLLLKPIYQASGETMNITAQVIGYPTQTTYGSRVAVRTVINGRSAKAMLYLDDEGMKLDVGDTVQLDAGLKQSTIGRDNMEFLYFQSIGVQLLAYGKSDAMITKCTRTPLTLLPVVFAERMRQTIVRMMPPDTAGFLEALLTGDKTDMYEQTRSEMATAGVSHVIAISGMHVTVLLGIVGFFTGGRRKLTAAIGIPVVILFAVLTGGSPSVWRAAFMLILLLLAPLLNRQNDPVTSLCAAMVMLLLLNPWAIANISFQLSFASMAGILLLSAKINRRLCSPKWVACLIRCKWTHGITSFVTKAISTSLGAIVATMPIAAINFGTVSVYCILSNILILWAVSIVFCAGLLLCLAAMVFPPLGSALGWLLAWPIRYIQWVAGGISCLPFAALYTTTVYTVFWLIFAYLIVAICLLARKKPPLWLPVGCITAGLIVCVVLSRWQAVPQDFRITVLDVGQGQSICMQTAHAAALCDCGSSSENEAGDLAARTLLEAGQQLDCLILTHYDTDHTNGVLQLFRRVSVQSLYLPDVEDETGVRAQIEAAAAANGTQIIYVREDTCVQLGDAELTIFAPVTRESDNDASLSLLFTADNYDMLITGDMNEPAEWQLLEQHTLPDTELYIAGHHGSKYASSYHLLDTLQPETVIVSVGYNSYGHPSPEALARFEEIGADVYRTDECGTATIGR